MSTISTIRSKNADNNDTATNKWIRRGFFFLVLIGAGLAAYQHAAGYVILGVAALYFLTCLYLKVIKV